MSLEITPIAVPFVLNVAVNCYLVKLDDGFILVDTGVARKRDSLDRALADAGCQPGQLKLIVLTHGDPDHAGNATYLRQKYDVPIAMHDADRGMVERGNMTDGRSPGTLSRLVLDIVWRFFAFEVFSPDVALGEGDDLSAYGLDARIVELPGHCRGNIGILSGDGDLFCGDLLANTNEPAVWSLVDDPAAMQASVEKLRGLVIDTVYPGHGEPFPIAAFYARSG